jgi:hypothetical protein
MDLSALVRLIHAKHELLIGISLTLLLIVTVLMLIRSVMEDRQANMSTDAVGDLDHKNLSVALEGAMKKVLAEKGIQGALSAAGKSATEDDSNENAEDRPNDSQAQELKKALNEREAKIAALMTDIEALKRATEKATEKAAEKAAEKANVTADGGVAPADVDVRAMQLKLAELQAKLAEYEIIEDDIADLSMYREENKQLKSELERLKGTVDTAQNQVQAASRPAEPVPRAQGSVESADASPPQKEKFELNQDDSVMKEFAEALSKGAGETNLDNATSDLSFESKLVVSSDSPLADPQAAVDEILSQNKIAITESKPIGAEISIEDGDDLPLIPPLSQADSDREDDKLPRGDGPLDDELDKNKLQSEVSKLADELEGLSGPNESESSILDESLDTEKLMQELAGHEGSAIAGDNSAKPLIEKPAEVPVEKPADQSSDQVHLDSKKPEIVESGAKPRSAAIAEDDLLAEFKDVGLSNTGTKGS